MTFYSFSLPQFIESCLTLAKGSKHLMPYGFLSLPTVFSLPSRYITKPKILEILEKSVPRHIGETTLIADEEQQKEGILCRFESVPLPQPLETSDSEQTLYVTWRKANGDEIQVRVEMLEFQRA